MVEQNSQKPNYNPAQIEHFEKLFRGSLEYAANTGLPLTVVEAACRDAIAHVEAHRMLNALRVRGAKL